MTKMIHFLLAMAVMVSLAGAVGFAQSAGEATYKTKCAMCHGAVGVPNPMMARNMGIKAASDPEIRKMTVSQMFDTVKSGKGKMKPVAGLTDAQIKDAVSFYRHFLNPQPLPPGL